MQAYRRKAIVSDKGTVIIDGLPYPAGESVEVVVFPAASALPREPRYPLRGTPIEFDDPIGPVAESDWETLS
jgi:hypothetical protein